MKRFFIFCLIAAALFALAALGGCSKNKCEGCTVTIKTYIDDVLQSENKSQTDCESARPGTTVKRADLAYGKTLTTIQTTKCY